MTTPRAFSPLFRPECFALARLARLPHLATAQSALPCPAPIAARACPQQSWRRSRRQPPKAAVVVSKPLPLLELVKARQTEPRQGTASEPAEPRQSTPGEVAEPSQATLSARTTTAAAKPPHSRRASRVKIGKCHETDKYPTKSDENLSIWSQTGQGNLSRRVPDPKNARGVVKNEGLQVWALFWRKGGGCMGMYINME